MRKTWNIMSVRKLKPDCFKNRAEGGGSTCSPLSTLRNPSPAGPSAPMSYGLSSFPEHLIAYLISAGSSSTHKVDRLVISGIKD